MIRHVLVVALLADRDKVAQTAGEHTTLTRVTTLQMALQWWALYRRVRAMRTAVRPCTSVPHHVSSQRVVIPWCTVNITYNVIFSSKFIIFVKLCSSDIQWQINMSKHIKMECIKLQSQLNETIFILVTNNKTTNKYTVCPKSHVTFYIYKQLTLNNYKQHINES